MSNQEPSSENSITVLSTSNLCSYALSDEDSTSNLCPYALSDEDSSDSKVSYKNDFNLKLKSKSPSNEAENDSSWEKKTETKDLIIFDSDEDIACKKQQETCLIATRCKALQQIQTDFGDLSESEDESSSIVTCEQEIEMKNCNNISEVPNYPDPVREDESKSSDYISNKSIKDLHISVVPNYTDLVKEELPKSGDYISNKSIEDLKSLKKKYNAGHLKTQRKEIYAGKGANINQENNRSSSRQDEIDRKVEEFLRELREESSSNDSNYSNSHSYKKSKVSSKKCNDRHQTKKELSLDREFLTKVKQRVCLDNSKVRHSLETQSSSREVQCSYINKKKRELCDLEEGEILSDSESLISTQEDAFIGVEEVGSQEDEFECVEETRTITLSKKSPTLDSEPKPVADDQYMDTNMVEGDNRNVAKSKWENDSPCSSVTSSSDIGKNTKTCKYCLCVFSIVSCLNYYKHYIIYIFNGL